MSKRKTPGYLQQLARPVPPGDSVLTTRAGAANYNAETNPAVPVIEDHFEMPLRTAITRGNARVRGERPAFDQASLPPVIESRDHPARKDAIPQPPAKAAAWLASSSPNISGTNAESPEPALPTPSAFQHGGLPMTASRETHGRVRHEKSIAAQPMRTGTVTSRVVADAIEVEPARMPWVRHSEENAAPLGSESLTATRIETGSDAGRIAEKTAKGAPPPSARQDNQTERTSIEAATGAAFAARAPQQPGKPEVQRDAGPRVHIGTVEIRMKLPQPPAPPPAAPAPSAAQNNTAMQGRGRTGSAEPLARGFEWSYGLVQG